MKQIFLIFFIQFLTKKITLVRCTAKVTCEKTGILSHLNSCRIKYKKPSCVCERYEIKKFFGKVKKKIRCNYQLNVKSATGGCKGNIKFDKTVENLNNIKQVKKVSNSKSMSYIGSRDQSGSVNVKCTFKLNILGKIN